jgi:hypothetical protein
MIAKSQALETTENLLPTMTPAQHAVPDCSVAAASTLAQNSSPGGRRLRNTRRSAVLAAQ